MTLEKISSLFQIKKEKHLLIIYDGYWEDIGTIDSYYHANLSLTDGTNCLDTYDEKTLLHKIYHLPSPMVKDSVIKHSVISQGAIIEAKK